MASNRNLSDFWREDKSDDRVMELTSVLRGADSIIGVMGSGVAVSWSTNGQSQTWWLRMKNGGQMEMKVVLDYSPLKALKAPFPGAAVDEVIGYAAHEGGHCLWSDGSEGTTVQNVLTKRNLPFVQTDIQEILRLSNILEDAYIDNHVGEKWPVLGEYIKTARRKCAERRPIDFDAIATDTHPTRNFILNLWIACSLYEYPLPVKMTRKVRDALTFLMSKSVKAIQSDYTGDRTGLAVDVWEYLRKYFPETPDPLPSKPPPMSGKGTPQEGDGSGQQGKGSGKQAGGDQKQDEGGGGGKAESDQDKAEGEEKGGGGGDEGEAEDEARGEAAGGSGETDDEPDENGPDAGDETDQPGDETQQPDGEPADGQGAQQDGGEQGGDEQGAPGNLDDFDLRDLDQVPDRLLEEVISAITHEIEDISKSVAEALTLRPDQVRAQTKTGDYDGPAADRVRKAVEPEIQELRRKFDRQAMVKSRSITGQPFGKLDTHSLAKVGTGNLRVYRRREILEIPDMAVGLLLDCSGSMNQYMATVWQTGCVFAEALIRKQGVNFLALTYTGGGEQVQTTRICDRKMGRLQIANVNQGGGTPSGPAIASIKVLMDRMPERQKIIIHFTDGDPDDKFTVSKAVGDARKAGYTVWCIGLKGMESRLEVQYGEGNYETITSVKELPAKVGELVQRLTNRR